MIKPPSIATLKTFDKLHAERGTRASAISTHHRKRGCKRVQIDGDPHVDTTALLPGTMVTCPRLGCGWKGERRQMWKHEKEHR
jgi:hypothetical protein